jgi:hypothetical protein
MRSLQAHPHTVAVAPAPENENIAALFNLKKFRRYQRPTGLFTED